MPSDIISIRLLTNPAGRDPDREGSRVPAVLDEFVHKLVIFVTDSSKNVIIMMTKDADLKVRTQTE